MASGVIKKFMDGTDSGWKELTKESDWSGGAIYYKRLGNVFLMRNSAWATCNNDISAKSSSLIGTINAADRPNGAIVGYAIQNGNGNPLRTVKIENGQVRLYNSESTAISTETQFLLNVIVFL